MNSNITFMFETKFDLISNPNMIYESINRTRWFQKSSFDRWESPRQPHLQTIKCMYEMFILKCFKISHLM